MDAWFTELQHPGLRLSCQITDILFSAKSKYQQVVVYDTLIYGRVLVLDGAIMTTDRDEFVYHEMLAHVPLMAHPSPKRVLVVGGGDGGIIREVIKHPSVELAHLVEIDELVIETSKKFFPQIACGLSDPRVKISVRDGIEYIKSVSDAYDVIIVDSTDPVGPAVGLFQEEFYRAAKNALRPDGIFVAQTESPIFHAPLLKEINEVFRRVFGGRRTYLATIPTYPGGFWCFSIGLPKYSGDVVDPSRYTFDTRYYTPAVHQASMVLPRFVEQIVGPNL